MWPCGTGDGQLETGRVGEFPKPRPRLLGGHAAELKDLSQLFHFVVTLEQGLPVDELAKDAAHAPHVDGGVVGRGPEDELRRAVPERDDELGESRGRWVADISRHAKVGNLELAAVVEEEVGRLEVPVEDPVFVQVRDSGRELEEETLDFGGEERLGHVLEDAFKIMFDEFENEKY